MRRCHHRRHLVEPPYLHLGQRRRTRPATTTIAADVSGNGSVAEERQTDGVRCRRMDPHSQCGLVLNKHGDDGVIDISVELHFACSRERLWHRPGTDIDISMLGRGVSTVDKDLYSHHSTRARQTRQEDSYSTDRKEARISLGFAKVVTAVSARHSIGAVVP